MLDWIRTSEEKISVSRDALSIEQSGEFKATERSCSSVQRCECLRGVSFFFWSFQPPDGNDAFVTGIILYRNLASILPFQR